MTEESRCVTGRDLLKHSTCPRRLRHFLDERADRIGTTKPSSLHKSVIVLRGPLGSNLNVEDDDKAELPMMHRPGKASPFVKVPELGNAPTTEPSEQRVGCDYVNPDAAARHFLKSLRRFLHSVALFVRRSRKKGERVREVVSECAGPGSTWVEPFQEAVSDFLEWRGSRTSLSAVDSFIRTQLPPQGWRGQDGDRYQLLPTMAPVGDMCAAQKRGTLARAWRDIQEDPDDGSRTATSAPVDEEAVKRSFIVLQGSTESGVHLHKHQEAIQSEEAAKPKVGRGHIVVQGAGNLSMNPWIVAYLGDGENGRVVHVKEEELDERRYACLICWKDNELRSLVLPEKEAQSQVPPENEAHRAAYLFCADSLSVARRVSFRPSEGDKSKKVWLVRRERTPIGDKIRFALSGQLLAWEGKREPGRGLVERFGDIRHFLDMVNLNPDKDCSESIKSVCGRVMEENPDLRPYFSDKLEPAYGKRPRYLYGLSSRGDVWLGEYAFRSRPELLRVAYEGPVRIPLSDLGAPLDWVTVCLLTWTHGHTLKGSPDLVAERGDFAWDIANPTDPELVWFPHEACYPCTLVGVGSLNPQQNPDRGEKDAGTLAEAQTSEGGPAESQSSGTEDKHGVEQAGAVDGDLFLLAWGHAFSEDQRYNIFDCAEMLCNLGAKAVLLIDAGWDVFQHYFPSPDELERSRQGMSVPEWSPVPPKREQLRATLAFWAEGRANEAEGPASTELEEVPQERST